MASIEAVNAQALSDGLPTPRRYWAIMAIALAITMSVLDSAIANVALPTIARDLNASPATSIWIVNAYQIAIVISLLPLASLGEIVGYRRVSQVGLVVFTIASLACALSPSLAALSLARVLQGFGAAGIMSVNGALVRFTYPHRLLGRAVGINALVVAISAAVGPTVASAILAVGHWRWLFGVNVPIGLVAIAIAGFALPANELSKRRLNLVGALLNAATFGLLITGLQTLTHEHALALGATEIGGGLIAGCLLIRREASRPAPLIPIDLLKVRLFGLSVATSICSFAAQMLAFVSLPFNFQERLGYSAVETGLLMTPWPIGVGVAAPLAGWLADRYPAGLLGGVGLAIFAGGLTSLALLPAHPGHLDIVWRMALCGIGFGFFQSPNNRAMLGAAPRARAGAAGGMLGTARLIGQSAGAVGVAGLFKAFPASGHVLALGIAAGTAALAAVVSLMRLVNPKVEPAVSAEKAAAGDFG
jgi:DHA2 family multidrug resistance protein-like MFS transporter